MKAAGENVTEKQVRRVMKRFGVIAVFPGLNLSKACMNHKKISVYAEGQSYQISESSLVNGYNIYQTSYRQRLSDGDNRLVQPEGFEMAAVQHNGRRPVCTAETALWRSLKYEDIYLKRYETMTELKAGVNALDNKEAA